MLVAYASNLDGISYDGLISFFQSLTEAAKHMQGVGGGLAAREGALRPAIDAVAKRSSDIPAASGSDPQAGRSGCPVILWFGKITLSLRIIP